MERPDFDRKRIVETLEKRPSPTIVVVGDFCLDKYLYIESALDEPSVETGLVAYQVRKKRLFPGAAGTIANNLSALGAKVLTVGLYGNDGEGFELIRELERIGADIRGMIRADALTTMTYIKPMRDDLGDWRELNRLDFRNSSPAPASVVEEAKKRLDAIIPQADALVVSDQFTREAGSILTDDLRDFLADWADRRPETFFLVDSRSHADHYRKVTVKVNASELLALGKGPSDGEQEVGGGKRGTEIGADPDADRKEAELLAAGHRLSQRNDRPVFVTRGALGAILFEGDRATAIPAQPVAPPIDICGAGDATDAGLTFGRAAGLTLPEAALVAGIVSSITIRQIGVTGTARVEEIVDILKKGGPFQVQR